MKSQKIVDASISATPVFISVEMNYSQALTE